MRGLHDVLSCQQLLLFAQYVSERSPLLMCSFGGPAKALLTHFTSEVHSPLLQLHLTCIKRG